jgi:hypothetical protein
MMVVVMIMMKKVFWRIKGTLHSTRMLFRGEFHKFCFKKERILVFLKFLLCLNEGFVWSVI